MIFDTMENAGRYAGLGAFACAAAHLDFHGKWLARRAPLQHDFIRPGTVPTPACG
jgi:hypothetical protein